MPQNALDLKCPWMALLGYPKLREPKTTVVVEKKLLPQEVPRCPPLLKHTQAHIPVYICIFDLFLR